MPETEKKPLSSWTKLRYALEHRLKLMIISLIIVTAVFYLSGHPVFATTAITLVWILVTLFVSMSACLLGPENKKGQ